MESTAMDVDSNNTDNIASVAADNKIDSSQKNITNVESSILGENLPQADTKKSQNGTYNDNDSNNISNSSSDSSKNTLNIDSLPKDSGTKTSSDMDTDANKKSSIEKSGNDTASSYIGIGESRSNSKINETITEKKDSNTDAVIAATSTAVGISISNSNHVDNKSHSNSNSSNNNNNTAKTSTQSQNNADAGNKNDTMPDSTDEEERVDPAIAERNWTLFEATRKTLEKDTIEELEKRKSKILEEIQRISPLINVTHTHKSVALPRNKTHYDALLDEVQWMANDFVEEKKWKVVLAHNLAKDAVKYLTQMKAKAEEKLDGKRLLMQQKSIRMAHCIKKYWNAISLSKNAIKSHNSFTPKRHSIARTGFNRATKKRRISDDAEDTRDLTPEKSKKLLVGWTKMSKKLLDDSKKDIKDLLPDSFLSSDRIVSDNEDGSSDEEKEDSDSSFELISEADDDNDTFDVEKQRVFLDNDDTDDEDWESGDCDSENNSSDDDEEGGDDDDDGSKDEYEDEVYDEDDLTDLEPNEPTEISSKLNTGNTSSQFKNTVRPTVYQSISRARRFREVNALCSDQLIPLSVILEPYVEKAGGDIDEVLVETIDDYTGCSDDDAKSTAALLNAELPNTNKMDLVYDIILKGTRDLERKRKRSDDSDDVERVDNKDIHCVGLIKSVRNSLLEYQANSAQWLQSMYLKGCHCTLNAPKGVGSVEIIAGFINNLAFGPIQSWGSHLIIVPSYVLFLWDTCLKQFCLGLKTITITNSPPSSSFSPDSTINGDGFNICLTTYESASRYNAQFRRIRWQTIIFDGADKIKDFKNDIISSSFSLSCCWRLTLGYWEDENIRFCKTLTLPSFLYSSTAPSSAKKGGKNAKDYVAATTYTINDLASSDDVVYEIIGCKPSPFHLYKYNAEKEVQKYILNNAKGKKEKQAVLLRALCALHFSANHACLLHKEKNTKNWDTFKNKEPLIVYSVQPCPAIIFMCKNKLVQPLALDFFNLNFHLLEEETKSFQESRDPITKLEMTRCSFRRLRVKNEAVETSMLNKDDGGPFILSVQMQHALVLQQRDKVCQHFAYINNFRCRRKPIYGIQLRNALQIYNHSAILKHGDNANLIFDLLNKPLVTKHIRFNASAVIARPKQARKQRGIDGHVDEGIFTKANIGVPVNSYQDYAKRSQLCSSKLSAISKLLHREKNDNSKSVAAVVQSKLVRSIIVVGIPHMATVVKAYLADRGIPYTHFDEYEGDEAPKDIVNRWINQCVRFNFDARINVGIICTANVGVCGALSAFHDVEQVIFTDCIEVDSDLPQGCRDFLEQMATHGRSAKLKVVRLYTEGTLEESLLLSKYNGEITNDCAKEGIVLVSDFAADTASHILGDNNKSFSNATFSDSFEEDIAVEQSQMPHVNGLVQENLIEKFDEVTVFIKDEALDIMFQNDVNGTQMDADDDIDLSSAFMTAEDSVTPSAIHQYCSTFVENSRTAFLSGTPAAIANFKNIGNTHTPKTCSRKNNEDSNKFFYEMKKKKSNNSLYGFVVEETKIQYDDPKSIAFRQALKRRIVDNGAEVDFNVYGPPNGETWANETRPLYQKSEFAGEVLVEPQTTLSARFYYPAMDTGVSIETFKNQSRNALASYRRRTEFQNYIGNLNIHGSPGILDSGRWAPWEDVLMKQAVASFGPNWHLIADMLNCNPKSQGISRSAAQCQNRLQKLNLQTFRGREYTKHQSIVSKYSWAAKPRKREDLLWNAPLPYGKVDTEAVNLRYNSDIGSSANNFAMSPAASIDRKHTIQNFENLLYVMNNQTEPPPILPENVVRMTNEPSDAHDSHAEAAKKANAHSFQSPMQIMRAKKKRRLEREKEKIQTVKLDSVSRFRSAKTINPFSKSSTYTRRLNQRQNATRNANSSSSQGSRSNRPSSAQSRGGGGTTSSSSNNNSRPGAGNRKQLPVSHSAMVEKRQRQLQGIIAHAAKKAGMDKPALQEVARLNPQLKKEIPHIVQNSTRNRQSLASTIQNIANLLVKAAEKHGIRLNR
jgi:hypothetical protein